MNKKELNNLVFQYQSGEEERLPEIFETVRPLIEQASDEVAKYETNFSKFDCRIITLLKSLAEKFDRDKHDFLSAAKALIDRNKAQYIRRARKRKDPDIPLSAFDSKSDDDLGFQFEDVLANVEETITLQEKIALLAQGEEKKELILLQWSGSVDDSTIASLLQQRFGGNKESHRKYVQRFRKQCATTLAKECA